ncbi:MAG: ribosomal L7Ae/L30e/S12e/Gadd45 family protein [Lachnospiraceae bacterium]|nr:ribosomal L7Ae/L30e/S12e/Gadd45 family protein [Lachnospiraceae bacterium]
MNQKKFTGTLGLAKRSGNLISGEEMTHESIRNGKACLVIVAADASDNTKKKFRNACDFYEVELIEVLTKEELGHAIGKEFRASMAVTDEGFAGLIRASL